CPAAGVGEPLRFRQISFAAPQRTLGPLLIVDVVSRRVPSDHSSVLIAQWHTADKEPAILAVSPAEALLHVEWLPCRQVSAPGGAEFREIIRMDREPGALSPQAVIREAGIGSPGLIDEIGRTIAPISRHACPDGIDGYPKLSFGLPL